MNQQSPETKKQDGGNVAPQADGSTSEREMHERHQSMRIPTIPARDSNLKAATIPIEGGQHWPVGTFMGSQRW
jgi:hypothetical protein